MPRSLVLSGGGRYADPWHPFAKTSARLADVLWSLGHRVEVTDFIADRVADLSGFDLIVVNAAAGPGEAPAAHQAAQAGLRAALDRGVSVLAVHTGVCALLRLPLSGRQILEAVAVTFVITLFILSVGNLSSLYNPRAVNPVKTMKTAAQSRSQLLLMLGFPITLLPVALAYLARYAFDTEWAFFGTLLIAGVVGMLVYFYSLQSALKTALDRREQIISALSQGEGPIEN